jgi:hypothetical protein
MRNSPTTEESQQKRDDPQVELLKPVSKNERRIMNNVDSLAHNQK